MNKILISVVGPTAIGKTKLAIVLAKYYDTEIISADSRQFYKEMDIGTAVPSADELKAAKHHFIQHKSIMEPYTVGDFEREAIAKLDTLFKSNEIVIMVGGSGLYVNAVTNGLDYFPEIKQGVREKLNKIYSEEGIQILQNQLKVLDPVHFNMIDIQNPHRLIRALEVCISSGKPYSSFLRQPKTSRNFKVITIGITAEREHIYNNINTRVDIMMQNGLLEEVQKLQEHQELNALQTVGYKELFEYLKGKWDLDISISEIKKNTRRFAKRQLTWFKKNKETMWINANYALEDITDKINKLIKFNINE
ncbi:tRNA (adenosine(37)-N6)-dimethylallyltransferase MiaA [Maribacter sp. CXY002]|uniref:tRNA (adenosine(37)-N6)-dimethylallyltransferase MiaA n=1 Tax=Maribacter luteocoastalis TaxID=3407671 RepID=UPI003B66F55E